MNGFHESFSVGRCLALATILVGGAAVSISLPGCASADHGQAGEHGEAVPAIAPAHGELVTTSNVNLWNDNVLGRGANINVCFAVRPRLQTDGKTACSAQRSKSVDCSGHTSHPTDGAFNPNALRAMIKDRIEHSWVRYGNVGFNWMGDCPIDPVTNKHKDANLSRTIVIQFEQQSAPSPGSVACVGGREPNACARIGNAHCDAPDQSPGFCKFDYSLDWSGLGPVSDGPTVIQYNWAALKLGYDFNLVHEFGHALGFEHEWFRSDFFDSQAETYFNSHGACGSDADCDPNLTAGAPGGTCATNGPMTGRCACDNEKRQTDGRRLTTMADASSIMNYCHAPDRVDAGAQLSPKDISGLLVAYGNKVIGPEPGKRLDYFQCGLEGDTCFLGGSQYVAFGADGTYTYRNLSGNFVCERATFNDVDPAPGVRKACHFANFTLRANEGDMLLAPAHKEFAFGANGRFVFRTFTAVDPSARCNIATFGSDPAENEPKACYEAVARYVPTGVEEDVMVLPGGVPLAYGANGKFLFKHVSSDFTVCSNGTFGDDPAPGTMKSCYRLVPRIAAEGESFFVGGSDLVLFGSGRNGNLVGRVFSSGSGTCDNATFGGDPDPDNYKRCYGPM